MIAYEQLRFFFLFIINGIIIGIVFDFFRALRKNFNTPDVITYLEDIAFWLISGIISILFIFIFNQGEIRNYTVLGIIFGIILYILLFTQVISKVLVNVIKYIKIVLSFILKPFNYILKKLYKILMRFYK